MRMTIEISCFPFCAMLADFCAMFADMAMSAAAQIFHWEAIAAVGTVLAAIIPGWAYFGERRERRRAQLETRQEREHQRLHETRELRERIANEIRRVRLYDNSRHMGRQETSIRIVNDSDDPIKGLIVSLEISTHQGTPKLKIVDFYGGDLEPGEQHEVIDQYTDMCIVWVTFVDVRGRHWSRDTSGQVRTWYPPGFEHKDDSAGKLFSSGFGAEFLPISEEEEKQRLTES